MASDGHGNEHFLKEWEIARSILNNFDDRLHKLRNFGFTFLTGFLAADAIIFQDEIMSVSLTDYVKLTVLGITMMLTVTLLLIDRNYRIFQSAAATRAIILERNLNLDLTEVIAQRYHDHNIQGSIKYIYIAFTVGALLLGSVGLSKLIPRILLVLAWILTVFFIIWFEGAPKIRLRAKIGLNFPHGRLDWTLDRLECHLDGEVRITLTNLREIKKCWHFEEGTIMWKIVREGEKEPVKIERAKQDLEIHFRDSYTWLWKVGEDLEEGIGTLKEGIYRVHRLARRGEAGEFILLPFRKKLWIKAVPSAPPEHPVIPDKKT